MKSIHVFLAICSLFFGYGSARANELANELEVEQPFKKVEVPLEAMLAPYRGYDNTNNVEIVLHGNLPNTCYQLDKHALEKDVGRHTLKVRQFAVRRLDGVCGEQNALPEQFNMTVPFTQVVSVGQLPAGDYTVHYNNGSHQDNQKLINVKKVRKATVDDYPYAAISNVSTTSVAPKNEKLSATLSGVFTSSCAYLDSESIRVEKQNDVYVVLPVLKMKKGQLCTQSLVPFSQSIDLTAPKEAGTFLVHVRSMNGKSANEVVEVIE